MQAILQASSKVEERTWAGKIHNIFLSPFVVRREPIPNVFAREAAFQVSNPYDIVEKAPEAFIAIQMTLLDYEIFASLKVSDFYTLNWKHNVDSFLISIFTRKHKRTNLQKFLRVASVTFFFSLR